MSFPNLLALAAYFSPRRIAKFLGLHGGKRRRRQGALAWLLLTAAAIAVATKTAALVLLHLAAVKQVSR